MRTMRISLLIASAIALAMTGTAAFSAELLLENYYSIQRSLAADSTNGVSATAARIVDFSRDAIPKEPQAKSQLLALSNAAAKLQTADLTSARNAFGDLSDRVIAYLQVVGAKKNPPYQFYCSMVKKSWLQADKQVRNPYYGKSMLTCGELVQ